MSIGFERRLAGLKPGLQPRNKVVVLCLAVVDRRFFDVDLAGTFGGRHQCEQQSAEQAGFP